jgi:outer membrane receptor for ferrienterochelin and colicins
MEGTRRMTRSRLTAALLLHLALTAALSATAQTDPSPALTISKSTYVHADFAQFAPQTALDMLRRVPGFSIREEGTERGLGQASGNVVLNGQRISGKNNDVITALGQIPARNVERIEIVDGATLGIPGLSGQVANVIARPGGIIGQYGYYPEFRDKFTDPRFSRFDISASGSRGPIEYTLGLDNRSSRSGAGGPTYIYDREGSLTELRDERWRSNYDQPRVSGKFVFDGPGSSTGNLNASWTRLIYDYLETGTRTGGLGDRSRRVTSEEEGDIYEIGGDYDFALGAGRLKLIGVNTSSSVPGETNVVTTTIADGQINGNRFTGRGDESERIGRAEYSWKRGAAEWQVSAEGAFNTLDNAAQLFTIDSDGTVTEVPFPGGTARVDEDRYEIMGNYGRSLGPDIALKISLGGEYSRLAAGGASGLRTFYRPKGEISTAWKVSPVTDMNLKLARRVGQLNFYDFLASVNLRDDSETAANPDLVPQQSWELDIEGVRGLGALGKTTLRAYARLIDDIIDFIPIGAEGQSPGNLDHASVYGISSRTTFNLDMLGWRGARVDAALQLQESNVEDPLTGQSRPISRSLLRAATVALRHDVPTTSWAWGSDVQYSYFARDYRLTEVGRLWEGPLWGSLYVEHKNVRGLTVRGSVSNLFGAMSMWDRTVYDGRRTGPVAFEERRDRVIGPIYSFSLRGKF